jgi:ATP-binding cassette, subfamily C, bacterial
MTREIRYGLRALRRRPLLALLGWSLPEALPAAVSGLAVARAVDAGFLAGRPLVGLAWLAVLVLAALTSGVGTRQVYRRLGDLVEPFRDDLVRRVVAGALRNRVAGRSDDGAVARLTHQVEIVRDTYAGLIVVVRGFVITVIGAVLGLLSTAPVILLLVLPPFAVGFTAFLTTLGLAAARQREYISADERLATSAGSVLGGVRDLVACGAEGYAANLVAGPVAEQAAAERALARVAAMRTLCFAVGGWLPLLLLLAAGPWLVSRGLTAGALLGGLTYVFRGLQPALGGLVQGLGNSGLRFAVTLGRILDAADVSPASVAVPAGAPAAVMARGNGRRPAAAGYALALRGVTFRYGPHADPVLRGLDLDLAEGDHLAVVGPSGVGKSTLAGLLCGLLAPDAGTVLLGGAPVTGQPEADLARRRVLIPQEAYAFSGSVWDNLVYLRPAADRADVDRAVAAVGATELVSRLGGYPAELSPAELSAGERQLLALARAYLSPAPVAVLDEATCHLDPAAERCAEEAFAGRGGTLVVVAHRISSALRARRVLMLDGVTAVAGDHRTVVDASPLYRDLLGHWSTGGNWSTDQGVSVKPSPVSSPGLLRPVEGTSSV